MEPASRTPEGEPNRCPICGHDVRIEPSSGFRDAPCPHCGYLLRFSGGESTGDAPRPVHRRLHKCYEHACKQTNEGNFDYATELLTQCVVDDPENLLYIRAYIENLQKKYGNNKKGVTLASFKELGARRAMKTALIANDWLAVVRQGIKVLTVNPWDGHILRSMATAVGELAPLGDAEYYLLKCALEANPKDPDTNRQCAFALADRGLNDQAIACWHRVEMARPGDKEALEAIAELSVRTVGTSSPLRDPREDE